MTASEDDFRRQYAGLNDDAFLSINREELIETARRCYDDELRRRGFKINQSYGQRAAQLLGKVDVGSVGVLTLDDGKCVTAEIVGFDEERGELVVDEPLAVPVVLGADCLVVAGAAVEGATRVLGAADVPGAED